jgi:hypothetical protein
MLSRKLRVFLDKPRVARLATVGRDGFPYGSNGPVTLRLRPTKAIRVWC